MEFILSSARSVELEEHVALLRDVCEDVGVVPPEQAPPGVVEAVRKHLERRAVAFSVVKPDMNAFETSAAGNQFGTVRAFIDPWLLEIANVAESAGAGGGQAASLGTSGSTFNIMDPSC